MSLVLLERHELWWVTLARSANHYRNSRIPDTIVIQVAAGIRNGAVTACRNFGKGPTGDSKYNRGSSPGQDSAEVRTLFGTVDIGAQAAATIVQSHQHISTVIFMTSSDELINAATNIWQYSANGFPELPAGLTTEDYFMLHGNLKRLEETRDGIKVAFWKVDKAFLANATFDVVCRLDEHEVSWQSAHELGTDCE